MGVHKHLVEVNGERLLDRTIRLIHERIVAEILTLAKHPEYENDMAMLVCPSDLENGGGCRCFNGILGNGEPHDRTVW